MADRLIIPTKGGAPSEADIYAQLLEYARLSQECAYTLAYMQHDDLKRSR